MTEPIIFGLMRIQRELKMDGIIFYPHAMRSNKEGG